VTYHIEADNLTIRLLDFAEFGQEIPESRLGNNGVRSEDAHAIQFWRWVHVYGQMAPDDLVLVETPYKITPSGTCLYDLYAYVMFRESLRSD
jgi:hypothetical protein